MFSSAARQDLQRVPPRIVPAIIEFVYGDLAREPRRVGKPLGRELEGSFGARRGSYRIIYDINNASEQVQVLRIDHRADLYRPR